MKWIKSGVLYIQHGSKGTVKRVTKIVQLVLDFAAKQVEQRFCAFYHPRKIPCNLFVAAQVRTWLVKRATSFLNSFCSNACKTRRKRFLLRVLLQLKSHHLSTKPSKTILAALLSLEFAVHKPFGRRKQFLFYFYQTYVKNFVTTISYD